MTLALQAPSLRGTPIMAVLAGGLHSTGSKAVPLAWPPTIPEVLSLTVARIPCGVLFMNQCWHEVLPQLRDAPLP